MIRLLLASLLIISSCKNVGEPQDENNDLPQRENITKAISKEEKTEEKAIDQRMRWQKPELVLSQLGDISNKVVADIGAGFGYFTFYLMNSAKSVIATDIDQTKTTALEAFKKELNDEDSKRLDIRLATVNDTKLEKEELDVILIVNTITYIDNRKAYIRSLWDYLRPGGQILIVDFKTKRIPEFTHAPNMKDRIYMHILEDELEEAGFTEIGTNDTDLDFQYMISAYKQ